MTTIDEGDVAPAFDLPSDSEGDVSLASLLARSKFTVLYFYPRDNTPGCTNEAIAFRDARADLAAAGARVVGVSRDSLGSHARFREKYAIDFPLLSDEELSVHKAYGAFGEKMMYGRKTLGTIRSTFVLDQRGTVLRAFRGVKVPGHVEKVLEVLHGAGGAKAGTPAKAAPKSALPQGPKAASPKTPSKTNSR